MNKNLTTKQMEMLILMEAVTNYYGVEDNEYDISEINNIFDDEIVIADFVKDKVENADDTDFEILKAFGFVDKDYKTTIYGKQYVRLFNEDCKLDDKKAINFKFIDKVELNFSLLKIEENSIIGAIAKVVPKLIKGKK